jgi:CMP-N-acetylneuraminic acid synthetase
MKALIPVRQGSQRVTNKNIRPFANSSLLEIKINQLKRIDAIEEICVNSDCDYMLSVAKRLGATPIKRDAYYASSSIPMNEVWKNMAENIDSDIIMYVNVTNPLVTDKTYKDICSLWNNLEAKYDSISTTHTVREYLWHMGRPLNYDPTSHPRSQDLPEYLGLNFAVSVIPKDILINKKSIIGNNFYPYIIDNIQAIDIDEEIDFEIAEMLYERRTK